MCWCRFSIHWVYPHWDQPQCQRLWSSWWWAVMATQWRPQWWVVIGPTWSSWWWVLTGSSVKGSWQWVLMAAQYWRLLVVYHEKMGVRAGTWRQTLKQVHSLCFLAWKATFVYDIASSAREQQFFPLQSLIKYFRFAHRPVWWTCYFSVEVPSSQMNLDLIKLSNI